MLAVGAAVGGLGFCSWWTGEVFLPFERGKVFFSTRVATPVGRFFRGVDGIVEMGRLEMEVETLHARVAELEWVALENERLREALGFIEEGRGTLVAARVVSRGGGSGWWREVKLGKGSDAGIAVGDAVVTREGLAGRVRSVTARSCTVMLVSDGNSRIGCELAGETDSRGPRRGVIVGGDGRWDEGMRFVYGPEDLSMRYVAGETAPTNGTRVVTSGMGGGLPQGILVGVVVEGRRPEGAAAFEAQVKPAVNLRDLDVVFVLIKGGGK